MKPMTSEWVAKAEADLITAQRELVASVSPPTYKPIRSL